MLGKVGKLIWVIDPFVPKFAEVLQSISVAIQKDLQRCGAGFVMPDVEVDRFAHEYLA